MKKLSAKDLMIGDWVVNTEFEKNEVDTIETLEPSRVWLTHGKTYVPIEYIAPVPLTEEILEKNGFELECHREDDHRVYFYIIPKVLHINVQRNDKSSLRKVEREKDWGMRILAYIGNVDYNLDYVHELQHAMRLCDVDKDIVL